jgi:flagellar biosynthesis repressor protein FlbT
MSLKISLKPKERIIMGGAVVRNAGGRTDLIVENTVPILREKDILREKEANTPCKRIYFAIQLMYVDEKNLVEYHRIYWKLVREVVAAAPSTLRLINKISEEILGSRYYQALKLAQKLIEYEQEVLNNAVKSTRGV